MRNMQSLTLLGTALALLVWQGDKGSNSTLKEVDDVTYKPGQVWSYKTRPGEEKSTLSILRAEAGPEDRRIVHIRVDNIRLKNCTGGNEPNAIEHMPFAREALDESVVKNIRSGPVPDFKNGYSEWRKAWDAGKAGVYTITVAQAVEGDQKTFDHGLGCDK
jgi:hypothetical protein